MPTFTKIICREMSVIKNFLLLLLLILTQCSAHQSNYMDGQSNSKVMNLANSALSLGDKEGALYFYRQAISENPKDEKLNYQIGRSCYDMGNFQEAFKTFQTAVNLAPKNMEYKLALAKTHLKLSNPDLAITEFEKILQRF